MVLANTYLNRLNFMPRWYAQELQGPNPSTIEFYTESVERDHHQFTATRFIKKFIHSVVAGARCLMWDQRHFSVPLAEIVYGFYKNISEINKRLVVLQRHLCLLSFPPKKMCDLIHVGEYHQLFCFVSEMSIMCMVVKYCVY